MNVERYGENGARIAFGNEISGGLSARIRSFYSRLRSLHLEGIVDIIPSFTTCLVIFDPSRVSYETLVGSFPADAGVEEGPQGVAVHEIPVQYGGEFGPDLEFVCSYCGLTSDEVIEIHTSSVYTVFAVGFMPGFPYLGPLDRRLFAPRLETPRLVVPEGSVGIAQLQTGIYPFDSPGGWRIIGKTGTQLFDYRTPPYSLLKIGDQVKFVRAPGEGVTEA
jgi:KipI family sensor histidine kinase inhibitor